MEEPTSNNNINAIKDFRKLFKELSSKETQRIRKKTL